MTKGPRVRSDGRKVQNRVSSTPEERQARIERSIIRLHSMSQIDSTIYLSKFRNSLLLKFPGIESDITYVNTYYGMMYSYTHKELNEWQIN